MKKGKKRGEEEKKWPQEKPLYPSVSNPCPLCGSEGTPLFDVYMECRKCKHIYRAKVTTHKGCPRCGELDFNPLFENKVECKRCKHVYEKSKV